MEAPATVRTVPRAGGESGAVKALVTHGIYFLCGFVITKGAIIGELAPFGASYAAAVPKKQLWWAISGTALGYIVLNPRNSFRYIAVAAAIGCIRWLLNDIKKISQSRLFACLAAALPLAVTGAALAFSSSSGTRLTYTLIEACLAGAAAFFLRQTDEMYRTKRSLKSFTQQETACLVMTGCILILSLSGISVQGVSLGRIIAVLVILLCACYGSVTGGSISAIATGTVFSLSGSGLAFLGGGYAFGGLMAGLFSGAGKAACAIAFTVCCSVMSFSSGDSSLEIVLFIEAVIASTVFMLLPKEVGNLASGVFLPVNDAKSGEAVKRNVVMRLDIASKAMDSVSDCVNKVSDKLKKLYSPTMDWVVENVQRDVCSNCGLKVYCLDKQAELTADDFSRLEGVLKNEGAVSCDTVDALFAKKCCKQQEIAESTNYYYREYLSCREAQRRVTGIRSVVAGQFSGLGTILKDMSDEISDYVTYDIESARRIEDFLKYSGTAPIECSCIIDRNGRMSVEIELAGNYKGKIRKSVMTNEISKCCGRRFDSPCITELGDRVRIAFSEMPYFDAQIGTAQHICRGGRLCGDSFNYFNNGYGSTVALISDGMGTGGRAAVDGNMAVSVMTRLCRAGLSYDCALQVVNSALMVKSEDESMATLDVADINMFTGRLTLMKAGAPLTYVKKNGSIIKKQAESLPVGILNNVKFARDSVGLSAGDWVVMVSDGAVDGDDSWLVSLIKTWNRAGAPELAQKIVSEAAKRRKDTHDDDITAVAIKLIDNE